MPDAHLSAPRPEPPEDMLTYQLCMLFRTTPSQIQQEDYETLMNCVAIHNAMQEYRELESRAKEKKIPGGAVLLLEAEILKLETELNKKR